jgi:glucosamine-6-phosphate deaminase
MKIVLSNTPEELGARTARETADALRAAIQTHGTARLLLSTGASQFTTFTALIQEDVEWNKVEMFHLDEYIGITAEHPASFVKYLNERFVRKVPLKAVHFVNPADHNGDVAATIAALDAEINRAPIDVGLIGIGENAHIAFNDPPADFEDNAAYKIVTLDAACRRQQLGEGWFPTLEDVPKQAISMTVRQILKCRKILSAVPYAVKANAVRDTIQNAVANTTPATILKTHADWTLFVDKDSAALLNPSVVSGL